MAILCAGGIGASLSPNPARAAPPSFQLPLACDLPQRCFVEFYVDHGPGAEVADYRCGARSYDTHRGTDFRVRDPADFAAGVPVLAAADGTVLATRDDMADIDVTELGRDKVAGMAGGNAVALLHDDGWVSQYWHMRRGSILVHKGDRVVAGQRLGTIGLSGDTNFPHLHFEVRDSSGAVVDPFNAQRQSASCQLTGTPMWSATALATLSPRAIDATAGFARNNPTRGDAIYGRTGEPPHAGSRRLYFWFELFGVAPNDVVSVQFILPDGTLRKPARMKLDLPVGYLYRTAGLDTGAPLPAGRYGARLSLTRPGIASPLLQQDFAIELK